MKWIVLCWIICGVCSGSMVSAQESLEEGNVVWHSQSSNASASMPVGGGDIGLNVWVENGELLIYVARSGQFDENNALLKSGRIRINLFPNPFLNGNFKQELKLNKGRVEIEARNEDLYAKIKVWVAVQSPLINIELDGNRLFRAEAVYENWRYQDRVLSKKEYNATSYKWAPPAPVIAKKDSVKEENNAVVFFHENKPRTVFDYTLKGQGLDSIKEEIWNPLFPLTFGGAMYGKGFQYAGTTAGVYAYTDFKGWKLKSLAPRKSFLLQILLHATPNGSSVWKKDLLQTMQALSSVKKQEAFNEKWWDDFWKRSFVHIGSGQEEISRNYQLFRYMLACNSKGQWPTKFNGGLFTVDPRYTDTANHGTPDHRNWGGGTHTAQNQRLVCHPMIRSGDFDLLEPQFRFYLNLLPAAEYRSRVYWNHNGACFSEQLENFGLPNHTEYGTKRPEGYDAGMEYNAWLEYEWDTVLEFCLMMLEKQEYTGVMNEEHLPFILSCLRFFEEHYEYLARKRGAKALDENGHLVLYPGSAAETYKMAYNANSTIAALDVVSSKMLRLPIGTLGNNEMKWLRDFRKKIPPLNYTRFGTAVALAPALHWERMNNTESPQLYPVFPWGIFGLERPGLDTALNTWFFDTTVVKHRSHVGWKQDNIFAARLGLAKEAWELTSSKLKNGERRFPAFWGPGFDWVPDHNWGGSAMIGLQEMLLQSDGQKIFLLSAWPLDKDVHFKLHAPQNTTVEAVLKNGKLIELKVHPTSRRQDVLLPAHLRK